MRQEVEPGIRGAVVDSVPRLQALLSLPSVSHLFFQWLCPILLQPPLHLLTTLPHVYQYTWPPPPQQTLLIQVYLTFISLRIHSWERNCDWLSSWVEKDHVDKTCQAEVHIFGGVERNVLSEDSVGWAGNLNRSTALLTTAYSNSSPTAMHYPLHLQRTTPHSLNMSCSFSYAVPQYLQ